MAFYSRSEHTEHVWAWEKVEEVLHGPWVSSAQGMGSNHRSHRASYSVKRPFSKNSFEDMVYSLSLHMRGSQKSLLEPSMAGAGSLQCVPHGASSLDGARSAQMLCQSLRSQLWRGHHSASSASPAGSLVDILPRRSLPKCPVLNATLQLGFS